MTKENILPRMSVDQLKVQSCVSTSSCDKVNHIHSNDSLVNIQEKKASNQTVDNSVEETTSKVNTLDEEEGIKRSDDTILLSKQSFVGRFLRDYTMKREINALIAKKSQQLVEMQTLVQNYQTELDRCIKSLEMELSEWKSEESSNRVAMHKQLTQMVITRVSQPLVDVYTCIGQLEQRRYSILQQLSTLRRTILETRREECDWLLKSVTIRYEDECEALYGLLGTQTSIENENTTVPITHDDPIFSNPEQLYDVNPHIQQLQLQLASLEAVLVTMHTKHKELEKNYISVPLIKRASFRERKSFETYPSNETKQEFQSMFLECRERGQTDTIILRRLCHMITDPRTRTGSLLHAFDTKIRQDTSSLVPIQWMIPSETMDSTFPNDRYYVPALDAIRLEAATMIPTDLPVILYEVIAIDTLELPSPSIFVTFTRFLTKVLCTEYDLEEVTDDDYLILEEILHERLFSILADVCNAYSIIQQNTEDDEPLMQETVGWYHWRHSIQQIQGISVSELDFPAPVNQIMLSTIDSTTSFLPQTRQQLYQIQQEITPRGVLRALMKTIRELHQEFLTFLSTRMAQSLVQRPSVLTADVLIPTLVLMMSRLDNVHALDQLYTRVQLLSTFRPYLLSEGCEEAYYVTCLIAAMQVIQTCTDSNVCDSCMALSLTLEGRLVVHEGSPITDGKKLIKRTSNVSNSGQWKRMDQESQVRNELSKWITAQPWPNSTGIGKDGSNWILPCEQWRIKHH